MMKYAFTTTLQKLGIKGKVVHGQKTWMLNRQS